jgi:metallo-beta-lactamase class B
MKNRIICLALSACATLALATSAALAAAQETLSQTYRESRMDDVEYQKSVGPIKVFDNLYYVGPGFVSVWLIPTSAGLILIDAAQEPYVDHVMGNIQKAGFNVADIEYILISHGHLDHFGGAARIQEASGARVVALAEDWQLIEQAGSRPGRGGTPPPRVPRRDMVVKDGDSLTLGSTPLKFYHLPGHTPGTLSAEFTVFDNGRPHKAFWHGAPGGRGGFQGAEDALRSAQRLSTIQGVEVAVNVHAWFAGNTFPNGSIFERAERLKVRRPGEPHPFVDPATWNQWVRFINDNAVKLVAEERAKAAAAPAQ